MSVVGRYKEPHQEGFFHQATLPHMDTTSNAHGKYTPMQAIQSASTLWCSTRRRHTTCSRCGTGPPCPPRPGCCSRSSVAPCCPTTSTAPRAPSPCTSSPTSSSARPASPYSSHPLWPELAVIPACQQIPRGVEWAENLATSSPSSASLGTSCRVKPPSCVCMGKITTTGSPTHPPA
ncbi:unnamed protein product [Lampetra planeri]